MSAPFDGGPGNALRANVIAIGRQFLTSVFVLASLAAPCSAHIAADSPEVRTLAGSGRLGIADGPALKASFITPVAVAYGTHGELYVVDEAAQRIREITNGEVHTIAGSGALNALGIHVDGGYKDGPARSARFNDPTGIAVSQDGDVYVADSGNHCIRRISKGYVTTVAGSPDRLVPMDGPATSAAFALPRALSFDDDGTLYVADFGGGIRRVARNGDVDTVAADSGARKSFIGISAFGKAPQVTIYADNAESQYVVAHLTGDPTSHVYGDEEAEGPGGSRRLIYGIAHVGNDQFLATDVISSSIRIYQLPQPPFEGNVSAPIVVGAAADDPSETAGYVDGSYEAARFYDPLGLAVHGSQLAVADTGNRLIRIMTLPDVRRSLSSANPQMLQRTNKHYRILYIGASDNFFGTSWATSVAGILEKRLNQAQQQLGLRRQVEVATVRIDSATLGVQEQFIRTYVPYGAFDLIIFGEYPYLFDHDPIDGHNGMESAGIALSRLQRDLGNQTRLFAFVYSTYAASSYVDGLLVRELRSDQIGSVVRTRDTGAEHTIVNAVTAFAKPVPVYSALGDFANVAATGSTKQLWAIDQPHESAAGRRFTADELYHALALMKPWR